LNEKAKKGAKKDIVEENSRFGVLSSEWILILMFSLILILELMLLTPNINVKMKR